MESYPLSFDIIRQAGIDLPMVIKHRDEIETCFRALGYKKTSDEDHELAFQMALDHPYISGLAFFAGLEIKYRDILLKRLNIDHEGRASLAWLCLYFRFEVVYSAFKKVHPSWELTRPFLGPETLAWELLYGYPYNFLYPEPPKNLTIQTLAKKGVEHPDWPDFGHLIYPVEIIEDALLVWGRFLQEKLIPVLEQENECARKAHPEHLPSFWPSRANCPILVCSMPGFPTVEVMKDFHKYSGAITYREIPNKLRGKGPWRDIFILSWGDAPEIVGAYVADLRKKFKGGTVTICTLEGQAKDLKGKGADEVMILSEQTKPDLTGLRLLSEWIGRRPKPENSFGSLIGGSQKMQHIYRQIEQMAKCSEPMLITGETGTGKKWIARELQRRKKQNVMTTVHTHLLDDREFDTLLEQRAEQLICIESPENLTTAQQHKLVQALRDHREAVFIFTSQKDLEQESRLGSFDKNLYSLIHKHRIQIPPLRERKEDIPLLVAHFIKEYGHSMETMDRFPPALWDLFFEHEWPENIEELKHQILGSLSRIESGTVTADDFKIAFRNTLSRKSRGETQISIDAWGSYHDARRRMEEHYLKNLLNNMDGDLDKVSKISGLSKDEILSKLKELGGIRHNDIL